MRIFYFIFTFFLIFNQLAFTQSIEEIEKNNLLQLAKKSILYRFEVMINQEFINKIYQSKEALTGFDINVINKESMDRFQFGKMAFRYLNHYKDKLNKIKTKNINDETENIKNVMTAFALATVMSDSYLLAYYQFNNNKRLRRLLNESDESIHKEKNLFKNAVKSFYSLRNRKELAKAKKIFQDVYLKNKELYSKYPVLVIAENLILSSYTYKSLIPIVGFSKTKNFFKLITQNIGISLKSINDGVVKSTESILYQGSKIFGNTAGLVQLRRGKLYNDESFLNNAKNHLRPLDVILEKTPFRLTDKFIPGYWGHAGIYIGTQKDLISLGIYNHPHVLKYHDKIENGATVIEALRSDVEFNTLKHFDDIDDFAILRLRVPLDRETQKEYILRAFSQIGKKYDFSFNVESSKTIVCSELQYLVFENVPFRTNKVLGRYTIDVDHIAEMGLTGEFFEPKLLYIDGKEVLKAENQSVFDSLIENNIGKEPVPFLKNKIDIIDVFDLISQATI